ncbi:Cupin domain-containing protein [Kineococcus xinjiangensis]|uniref:Cupin domain-containing protein n=1 Tax=Kineococcus xinjiangensis TaxID=512762 RepID=A0A2S6ID37_9ACTN|nr:cupin domain-containing protein [Kineococcus xinjiangensis]PPK92080.1 Cupin domain-containing protein [Kineococcus xinjiangensis]
MYPWEAADGLHGGSPHLHTCCSECYVVVGGTGELHTLTAEGPQRAPLTAGDVVWFTPGTVHRAVDTGGLRVVVVMENGGLPEAGDAVLTFPPEHLADEESYRRAASILGPDGQPSPERARARRDLAVAGYTEILRRTEAGDASALAEFHAAAARLVAPRLADFRSRWEAGAAAAARRTGELLTALADGNASHLAGASVRHLPRPAPTLGMCGTLAAYDGPRRALTETGGH